LLGKLSGDFLKYPPKVRCVTDFLVKSIPKMRWVSGKAWEKVFPTSECGWKELDRLIKVTEKNK
jgi:hypothetical protein